MQEGTPQSRSSKYKSSVRHISSASKTSTMSAQRYIVKETIRDYGARTLSHVNETVLRLDYTFKCPENRWILVVYNSFVRRGELQTQKLKILSVEYTELRGSRME